MAVIGMRVITTHVMYTAAFPPADVVEFARRSKTGESMAEDLGDAISPNGRGQRLKFNADDVGWVAINPAYVVAIELIEGDAPADVPEGASA